METSKAQAECDKAIELNSCYGDIYVQMAKVQTIAMVTDISCVTG